jgi:hypothetical protein
VPHSPTPLISRRLVDAPRATDLGCHIKPPAGGRVLVAGRPAAKRAEADWPPQQRATANALAHHARKAAQRRTNLRLLFACVVTAALALPVGIVIGQATAPSAQVRR